MKILTGRGQKSGELLTVYARHYGSGDARQAAASVKDMDRLALIPGVLHGSKRHGQKPKEDAPAGVGLAQLTWSRHGAFTPHTFMSELRTEYPELREARMFVVDLGPGELLYLPAGWGHCVHNVEKWSAMVNYWIPGRGKGVKIWDDDA